MGRQHALYLLVAIVIRDPSRRQKAGIGLPEPLLFLGRQLFSGLGQEGRAAVKERLEIGAELPVIHQHHLKAIPVPTALLPEVIQGHALAHKAVDKMPTNRFAPVAHCGQIRRQDASIPPPAIVKKILEYPSLSLGIFAHIRRIGDRRVERNLYLVSFFGRDSAVAPSLVVPSRHRI